jgi:hypothetical protein
VAVYEHRSQPLLHPALFRRRVLLHVAIGLGLMAVALGIGVLGYRTTEGMSWIDDLLNASMILGGMGPVSELHSDGGKLFASIYALFAGVVFIALTGVLLAPLLHRLMHRFHLPEK